MARKINSLLRCRLDSSGGLFHNNYSEGEAGTIKIEFKFHDLRSSFPAVVVSKIFEYTSKISGYYTNNVCQKWVQSHPLVYFFY